jgi:S1-C subfamily serine protease
MGILANLSAELAGTVSTVEKSVVRVEGRHHWFASGTVWSLEGLIVTAHHVLTNDENIRVGLGEGEALEAKLIGRDPTTDLALIKVDARLGEPAEWIDAESLRVGHLVLALARPGKTARAVFGIISALGKNWLTTPGGNIDHYIQPDVPTLPGFSGGPLVTAEGKVAGINTSGLIRDVLIALPASTVKRVVDELLQKGRISRGYIGVGIQPALLPEEIARQLGQETGLLIISVEPGSPAEKAGLVLGDAMLTLGGEPVIQWNDLTVLLGKERIGRETTIRILRGGQVQEKTLTVGERP